MTTWFFLTLGSAALFFAWVAFAPEGYEDESGFHYGQKEKEK